MWRPYLIKDIKLLEGPSEGHQVGSLHGIADLKEAYDDRTRLGLFFLENRRLRSDLTETYKILNGNCSRPTNREFFLYR